MSGTPVAIHLKRLAHGAGLAVPQPASAGAAGADVQAAVEAPVTLAPLARAVVPTGFAVEIPEGFEIQVRPRSGLAARHGVTLVNTPGTIDADYRGEIKVILINLGQEPFTVLRGERIAQLVVAPVARAVYREVEELGETARGADGFGSTGR